MQGENTTFKKQKFIGVQEFVNTATGEVIPMQIRMIEERDFNFHKVWLQHLVNGLDEIANQKLKLAFWIIDNLNNDNQLVMTQQSIAKATKMSYDTVNRTIKALCKEDESGFSFLQKIQSGAYRVNPNAVYKGSHSNRMGICYQYNATAQENKQKQEEVETYEPISSTNQASTAI